MPDPKRFLAILPPAVRDSAHVFDSGRVAWPAFIAREAIDALADNGAIVLGLDARTLHSSGAVHDQEISDWWAMPGESWPDQVERARDSALAAVDIAIHQAPYVVITWDDGLPER